MPTKRKGNRRGAGGVANNEPIANDASRKRNFHIILCLPLSREDIQEVEERYGNSAMNRNRVADDEKPGDENAPNPIMDPTQLDYTDLQPMNENKLGNSQIFNSRQFVDSLAKPVQGEQVPETVSTLCWWDGYPFQGRPIGIPLSYHEHNGYRTRGIYCSPQCAAAAIWNQSAPAHDKWEQYILLHNQVGWSYRSGNRIRNAPERFTLVPYGGTLTIDEFRELNQRDDKVHRVIYPPCIADTPIFEVSTQDEFTAENTNKHVPLEEERVKNAMAQLNQQKATAAASAVTAPLSKNTGATGKRAKKPIGKKTLVSLMNLKVRETA